MSESFNKMLGLRSATLFKKETLALVLSCKFYETSKNTFSYKTPPVAASVLRFVYLTQKVDTIPYHWNVMS